MKRFGVLLFVALCLLGCRENTKAISEVRKEELWIVLAPGFAPSSILPDQEEAFYQILEAFAAQRRSNEFVSRTRFDSDIAAVVYFVNGNIHGENMASAQKKDGKWKIAHKVYSR